MNVLLIEKDSYVQHDDKKIRTAYSSVQAGLLLQSELKTFFLVQHASINEEIALSYGFECLYEPLGMPQSYKLMRLLKKHEISFVCTFDTASAKLISPLFFWMPDLHHIHYENSILEKPEIFLSKCFKKTETFLFADKYFYDYYSLSLEGRNSQIIPFPPSSQYDNLPTQNIESFKIRTTDSSATHKKILRFFIPSPLYSDQLEIVIRALELFEQYEGHNFQWEAYFCGIGEHIDRIMALCGELNILEHIAIFRQDPIHFPHHPNDICIIPSNVDEYSPEPLFQAWKRKLPVILTENLPYCDLIKNNENVLIPDMPTQASLSGTLHRVIHDENLRQKLILQHPSVLEKLYTFSCQDSILQLFKPLKKN